MQYKKTLHQEDDGPNWVILFIILLILAGIFFGALGVIHLIKTYS